MNEQQLYDQAAAEYHQDAMDTGLWARAMSEVDGDEARARDNYIALRAAQLAREQRGEDPTGAEPAEQAPPASQPRLGLGRWALFGGIALAGVVLIAVVALAL